LQKRQLIPAKTNDQIKIPDIKEHTENQINCPKLMANRGKD
jgi:hypothetical protein